MQSSSSKTELQVSFRLSKFFVTYSLILMLLISKLHGLNFSQACGWNSWLYFVRCWCPALLFPSWENLLLGLLKAISRCLGTFELKGLELLTLFINYS